MEDKVEQHIVLYPWIYGSFELIQHAEEHLKVNGDFDKRMALISFDNAIELTITTFLQLHPSQRNGLVYPKPEIEKWLANYHTKLDFFEMYVKSTNQKMKIPKPTIIWSHKQRNELYHDGKGMVPGERILKEIRVAAFYVFSTLFNIDVEELLKTSPMLNGAEQIEPAKQRDDKQYIRYIETWVKYIDLDNWTDWTAHWILASTMPKISYKQLDNLEELEHWLLSTIWPERYPELDAAFENFRRILHDLVSVHYRYSSSDKKGEYSVTDKYLQHFSIGSSDRRLTTEEEKRKEYKCHIELLGDLMFELTRATNYICDKVRQFIDPTFRVKEGAVLVAFGLGDFHRTEYRENERVLYPYPGLKQFEKDRKKRDIDRSRYGIA